MTSRRLLILLSSLFDTRAILFLGAEEISRHTHKIYYIIKLSRLESSVGCRFAYGIAAIPLIEMQQIPSLERDSCQCVGNGLSSTMSLATKRFRNSYSIEWTRRFLSNSNICIRIVDMYFDVRVCEIVRKREHLDWPLCCVVCLSWQRRPPLFEKCVCNEICCKK